MNAIVDVYEFYFTNLMTFHFDLFKRKQHDCAVCSENVSDIKCQIYSREKTEKFIIEYLEHLKIFGFSVKTADLFIDCIRKNGILSPNVKGFWKIRKDYKYELYVIEHIAINRDVDDEQLSEDLN